MEEFSHIEQNTDYVYNYYQQKIIRPPLLDGEKILCPPLNDPQKCSCPPRQYAGGQPNFQCQLPY